MTNKLFYNELFLRTNRGMLGLAITHGHTNMVEFLCEIIKDTVIPPNSKNVSTILTKQDVLTDYLALAVQIGNDSMVDVFLKHGARIRYARSIAEKNDDSKILTLFDKHESTLRISKLTHRKM